MPSPETVPLQGTYSPSQWVQSEQLRQWNPAVKKSHQGSHQPLWCVSSLCGARCTEIHSFSPCWNHRDESEPLLRRLLCVSLTFLPPSSVGVGFQRENHWAQRYPRHRQHQKNTTGIPVIRWKTHFWCLTGMQKIILYKANRMNCNNWKQRELSLLIWGKGSRNLNSYHLKQWQRIYQQFIEIPSQRNRDLTEQQMERKRVVSAFAELLSTNEASRVSAEWHHTWIINRSSPEKLWPKNVTHFGKFRKHI